MLAIFGGDNRLSKGSLEEPAFLNPIRMKGRIDALEVRQE